MTEITKSFSSVLADMGIDGGTQKLLAGSHTWANSYVTTEVKGLSELDAALGALAEKVAKKSLLDAMRGAAALFQASAKGLAPYDPDVAFGHPKWRTMHLRDGILKKIKMVSLGAAGARIYAVVGLDKDHVFFGRIVEFGHITAGGIRRAKHGSKYVGPGETQVAPHPFMRPAFETMKGPALSLFEFRLREGIEAAARELAR
jgi:HK97 gp10 family phage protein